MREGGGATKLNPPKSVRPIEVESKDHMEPASHLPPPPSPQLVSDNGVYERSFPVKYERAVSD